MLPHHIPPFDVIEHVEARERGPLGWLEPWNSTLSSNKTLNTNQNKDRGINFEKDIKIVKLL